MENVKDNKAFAAERKQPRPLKSDVGLLKINQGDQYG